jgi:hypothetical protein
VFSFSTGRPPPRGRAGQFGTLDLHGALVLLCFVISADDEGIRVPRVPKGSRLRPNCFRLLPSLATPVPARRQSTRYG